MKEQKIKVLALLPMELPKEIELDNTLEAMQKFVDMFRSIPLDLRLNHMSTSDWSGALQTHRQKERLYYPDTKNS